MALATLINPQGLKKVVTVGSPEAQNLLNQGYSLMGKTGQAIQNQPITTAQPVQASTLDPRQQFESQGYKYLGTQQGVQSAIQQYGKDRVKNIAGDYFVVPKGLTPPKPGQAIDATKLSPYQELSNLLGSNITPDMVSPEIAGLLALQNRTTDSEKQYDELSRQLTEQMKTIGGQGQDLQAELDRQGVTQAFQQVKELNLRAAQLQGELEQFDTQTKQSQSNLEGQAIPTGLIQGQQAQLQQQRDITRMGKAAELSGTIALSQAYQGNAQLGMQLAEQAVDLKYQPILNNIEVLKTQLSFAGEKMNKEDQKRASVIGELIQIRMDKIQEAKDQEKEIQSLAIQVASMGAPLDVVNRVKGMKDPVTAAQAAGEWIRKFNLSEENRKRGADEAGKLQPSAGFFDAGVEADVRASYSDFIENGLSGREAYNRLRKLYSPNEASDDALKQLTGTAPIFAPGQTNFVRNPAAITNAPKKGQNRISRFLSGFNKFFRGNTTRGNTQQTRQNSLTSSISGYLFGK